MRCDQSERVVGLYRNLHFRKAAAEPESPSIQQEVVIRVRPDCSKWKLAQYRHMNVRIEPGDMIPKRKIHPLGCKRLAQLLESRKAAHFLQSQHIRLQCQDVLTNLCFGFSSFGRAGLGRLIQIIFDVVGGDAKGFRAGDYCRQLGGGEKLLKQFCGLTRVFAPG